MSRRAPGRTGTGPPGRARVGARAVDRAKQAAWSYAKRWLIGGGAIATAGVVLLVLMISLVTGTPSAEAFAHLDGILTEDQMARLDELATGVERPADIPPLHFALYLLAADERGLDWAILAGIGKVECDHGRSQLEGCNPPGTVNPAGARGPMQFLGSTWRAGADAREPDVAGPPVPEGQESRGYATDADEDGTADPWVANDAVHATARYLARNGAPADDEAAIHAYNHSDAYVVEVLRWAELYRTESAAGGSEGAAAPTGAGPADVTDVRCPNGDTITVAFSLADSLQRLLDAAAADGLALCGWGFRSPEQQVALRREHCGPSYEAVYVVPASACTPPTARPGFSLHEQGLAVDFENCSSRSQACWQWLDVHAAAYGLYNLPTEPWHWSIDGS